MTTVGILRQIRRERLNQDTRWGEQNHPNGTGSRWAAYAGYFRAIANFRAREKTLTWRDILLEEVYEALAERDPEPLREELIQVAAVATAWVEAIDRKEDRSRVQGRALYPTALPVHRDELPNPQAWTVRRTG